VGDRSKRAETLQDAGEIVCLNEDAGQIALKIGAKAEPFEATFSLIPSGPIDSVVLREAIYRYAESVIDGAEDYAAIRSILRREYPRIRNLEAGQPIIQEGVDVLEGASSAISRLDESYMLVQGPPGTGKTYLSARAIPRGVEPLYCRYARETVSKPRG
jgi:uncharacterized protein